MKKSGAYLRIFFSLTCLLVISVNVSAQENLFTTAEKLFDQGEYYSAARLYEQFLAPVDKTNSENAFRPYFVNRKEIPAKNDDHVSKSRATWKLAESYRLVNDFGNAEKWYRTCNQQFPAVFPLLLYRYGICLRANKNYTEAETVLHNFLETYKENDEYAKDAKKELDNLSFISKQLAKEHTGIYNISKLVTPSEAGCFAAGFADDSTFVVTSTQTDSSALTSNKNPYSNRLFATKLSGEQPGALSALVIDNNNLNQGAASFLPNRKTMFFTQWEKKDGKTNAAIYSSAQDGNKWSKPVKLPMINIDGFNAMQPAISSDGRHLFFSSDRPGGEGNFDIWYADLDDKGNVLSVRNAGKQVNTAFDEKAPFYTEKQQQLVFSTNGRTGFGGYDFFITNGKSINEWGEPLNMGMPFNSSKDDIYFFARESKTNTYEAYISSDRESACCLELYRVEKAPVNRAITGLLIDCNTSSPLPGGNIYIASAGTKENIDSLSTDDSGKFVYTLGNADSLFFTGSKVGYSVNKISVKIPPVSSKLFDTDTLSNIIICLAKESPDTAVTEPGKENDAEVPGKEKDDKNIILYFNFDKSDITKESKEKLDAVVKKLTDDPSLQIEIGGYTDEKGTDEYNLDLGYKRAKAAAKYIEASGISLKRITLKSYGECCPVSDPGEDKKDELSRRVQFIYLKKVN